MASRCCMTSMPGCLWPPPQPCCMMQRCNSSSSCLTSSCESSLFFLPTHVQAQAHHQNHLLTWHQIQVVKQLTYCKLLALNTAPLYTQNSHYFNSLCMKWHICYKDVRQNSYKFLKPDLESMKKQVPPQKFDYELGALRNLQNARFTGLTKESQWIHLNRSSLSWQKLGCISKLLTRYFGAPLLPHSSNPSDRTNCTLLTSSQWRLNVSSIKLLQVTCR